MIAKQYFARTLATAILAAALPALAQTPNNSGTSYKGSCGAPDSNGANSTSYYGSGDPCAYMYSVPAERVAELLRQAGYCSLYSRTQVVCSRPVTGNFGQTKVDRLSSASASGGTNTMPTRLGQQGGYVGTNATASPAQRGGGGGVNIPTAPGQPIRSAGMKPTAERLFQQGSSLYDREDFRNAFRPVSEAARLGHPRAQSLLGIMFQNGEGVKADDRQAAYWFTQAAAQGHRAAQHAIGAMYEEGEGGLPRDIGKAVNYYTLSARQGYDKAQFALALCYEFGTGVPRDRRTAITWLNAAAAQGDGRAAWIAEWLRRPNLPKFRDGGELGQYINSQVAAHYATGRSSGTPCPSCVQELEQKRVWQANEAAGIHNHIP